MSLSHSATVFSDVSRLIIRLVAGGWKVVALSRPRESMRVRHPESPRLRKNLPFFAGGVDARIWLKIPGDSC